MQFPSLLHIRFAVVAAVTLTAALAQDQAPAQGQAGPAAGTTGTASPGASPGGGFPSPGGRGQQNPFPTDRQQQQQRFPDMGNRPIFISGKVVLEDGTAPPEPVTIERVCNGVPKPEAYTDSKGRFSFQLGQSMGMMQDASVSSDATGGFDPTGSSRGGTPGFGNMGGMNGGRGISERDLMGCEIRAALPGFRSEAIPLAGRRSMDNPDLGTIIMRRMGNVEGLTVSATTAAAPKDARKAYEKARDLARKKKMPEAQKEYEKAVALYPKYANAWTELGMIHESQDHIEDARKAYSEALAADAKLVKPYVQMAFLWARENKWKETAEASERALKLNPFDFPQAYFINAVANLNLQNLDAAEKSVREGIKLDANNRIPKMRHVFGIVLAQKQDYAGATEQMKGYLSTIPAESPEAATVKKQLAEVQRLAGNQPAAASTAAQQ